MVELHVLGSAQALVHGRRVKLQRKQLGLLTYLALAKRRGLHRRDALVGVFWPEQSQASARTALRQPLAAFRRELGEDIVVTEGDDEVGLALDHIDCDALAFDEAVSTNTLEHAVELYNGPVLDGFYLRGCPEFEHWLDGERLPRARMYAQAIEQLAAQAQDAGHLHRAIELMQSLVFNDPYGGHAARLLMRALESAGQRSEALLVGDRYVSVIRRDLEAEPDPKVVAELHRMRAQPVAIPTPVTPLLPDPQTGADTAAIRAALSDSYRIVDDLGGGPFATVYLAEDLALPRTVAVKILKPEYAGSFEDTERFLREVQFLARLSHPHIVTLLRAGEAKGFLYYVMAHIDGETLRERIRRLGRLSIDESLRITQQVASALEYSHGHGVIHRDIKPDNILLQGDEAVVIDFGIGLAVSAAGGKRLTKTGLFVGTPEYMAPEQSSERDIDRRTDVYALGCVLYEMLTGEPLYSGATAEIVISRHRYEQIPSARVVRPAVSTGLERVLHSALAKDRADRFASAVEFADQAASSAIPRDFIYAAYAQADTNRILTYIAALRDEGRDVWYDERIPVADDASLARKIEQCCAVVVFLTRRAVAAQQVRRELEIAASFGKPVVVLKLEPELDQDQLASAVAFHETIEATSHEAAIAQMSLALASLTKTS